MAELESCRVLHSLLVANPIKPTDKCTAIVDVTAHLRCIYDNITKCHMMKHVISLEQSNFDAAMKQLDGFQESTLTFVIVAVTGAISPSQVEQLLGKACGSVRLVLIYTPSLMSLLTLLNLTERVHIPDSIETTKLDPEQEQIYSRSTPVGSIIHFCQTHYAAHPDKLSPRISQAGMESLQESEYIDVESAVSQLHVFRCWQDHLPQVVDTNDFASQCLGILVTSDLKLIELTYKRDGGARIIDASKKKQLDQLDDMFENQHSWVRTSHTDASPTPRNLRTTHSRIGRIVMLNAHFLPIQKVHTIVARWYTLLQ